MLTEKMYVSIGEAARMLGVSKQTLEQWDKKGILRAYRLPTGFRRYSVEQIRKTLIPPTEMIQKAA